MDNVKYIGMRVYMGAFSTAVLNSSGKPWMECTAETKAAAIFQFFEVLRGSLHITLEKST